MPQTRIGYGSTVSFTRPNDTTGYTANDVVGAAAAALKFDDMGMHGAEIYIGQVELLISDTGLIASEASYSLALYNVTPPSALADNAPFDVPAGDRAAYLGAIVIGTPVDIGSSLFILTKAIDLRVRLKTAALWGYLITAGAYTPSAQRVYRVGLHSESR